MPFMPCFVKPEWHQSPTNITIKLPSYGSQMHEVDLVTHDNYLKAHYQQYIFEAFLFKPISIATSTCFITDDNIIFELTKATEGIWEQLEIHLTKSDKRILRNQIIKEIQEKTQDDCKQKVNKLSELKRTSVKLQMNEDTKRHDMIKDLKKKEETNALKEMQIWEMKHKEKKDNIKDDLLVKDMKLIVRKEFKKSNDRTKYKSVDKEQRKEVFKNKNESPIEPVIPMIRKCQSINVSFTPREFPTPIRESKIPEEEEWLEKQVAARRSVGFHSDDLRPEERNPQWLLAKGNEFFKFENYLGAISAYTEGIKISKNFVDLYVRRSEVHYLVKNYQKTIEDCSKAIDIMRPPVPANLVMRIECIHRRGNALREIGFTRHAIGELEAALKLSPDNAIIKRDLREAYMAHNKKKETKE